MQWPGTALISVELCMLNEDTHDYNSRRSCGWCIQLVHTGGLGANRMGIVLRCKKLRKSLSVRHKSEGLSKSYEGRSMERKIQKKKKQGNS